MKNILMIITSLATVGLLTGCPGKKSTGAPYHNNGLGCVSCGMQNSVQAQFGTTMTSQIAQASLTLAFTGDAGQLNYWANQGQNPIFTYQGSVGLNATLNVGTELYLGNCRVPVGTYQTTMTTMPGVQSNGVYNMGVFQFSHIQMTGAVNMTFALADGVILTDGLGNIRSFSGLLVALTGIPAMQTWGGVNPMMPGQMGCGDSIGVRF
jgi:hypothetical protein